MCFKNVYLKCVLKISILKCYAVYLFFYVVLFHCSIKIKKIRVCFHFFLKDTMTSQTMFSQRFARYLAGNVANKRQQEQAIAEPMNVIEVFVFISETK